MTCLARLRKWGSRRRACRQTENHVEGAIHGALTDVMWEALKIVVKWWSRTSLVANTIKVEVMVCIKIYKCKCLHSHRYLRERRKKLNSPPPKRSWNESEAKSWKVLKGAMKTTSFADLGTLVGPEPLHMMQLNSGLEGTVGRYAEKRFAPLRKLAVVETSDMLQDSMAERSFSEKIQMEPLNHGWLIRKIRHNTHRWQMVHRWISESRKYGWATAYLWETWPTSTNGEVNRHYILRSLLRVVSDSKVINILFDCKGAIQTLKNEYTKSILVWDC